MSKMSISIPFTLHVVFPPKVMIKLLRTLHKHTKAENQASFPVPLFLDCFLLIKCSIKASRPDEMKQTIPEDDTFTPSTGNNLVFFRADTIETGDTL